MSYKIIDYEGETLEDGFVTATDAYTYMSILFTKDHIKNMSLRVVQEENDER